MNNNLRFKSNKKKQKIFDENSFSLFSLPEINAEQLHTGHGILPRRRYRIFNEWYEYHTRDFL